MTLREQTDSSQDQKERGREEDILNGSSEYMVTFGKSDHVSFESPQAEHQRNHGTTVTTTHKRNLIYDKLYISKTVMIHHLGVPEHLSHDASTLADVLIHNRGCHHLDNEPNQQSTMQDDRTRGKKKQDMLENRALPNHSQ